MRTFSVIGVMVLLFVSVARTTSEDNLTAPPLQAGMSSENSFATNTQQCRASMRTLAGQAVIFFAANDRYPRNLKEIDMAGTVCPTCGLKYQLTSGDDHFYIECPLSFSPDHGNIDDGVTSWVDSGN